MLSYMLLYIFRGSVDKQREKQFSLSKNIFFFYYDLNHMVSQYKKKLNIYQAHCGTLLF